MNRRPHGPGTILVVGPNLTIDRTARIARLVPGTVLRTGPVAVTPGGKGVNVVRAATRLGAGARLVGFAPGRLGEAVAAMLAEEHVPVVPVRAPGELRSALIVTDDDGRVTVLNEPGPLVQAEDWDRLEAVVGDELGTVGGVVCSGSIPPGGPDDAYARVVVLARRAATPTFVDAGGRLLAASLPAGPGAVLPNLREAEAVLGLDVAELEHVDHGDDAPDRALRAATALRALGARVAVVTAGAAGAAVAAGPPAVWVPAPTASVTNPVGAGDAFTAGYAVAALAGLSPEAATRYAVAVGAASVERPLAGALDPDRAADLGAILG